MTKLLNNLYALRISDNLTMGGGCGLNSSYNGQIVGLTPFKHCMFHAPRRTMATRWEQLF